MIELEKFRGFLKKMLEHDPILLVHSFGVTNIVWQLAVLLNMKEELHLLVYGALLHDIGKTEVAKEILQKPGPLNAEERLLIQHHPIKGASLLAEQNIEQEIQEIVLYHHERWDGTGYLGLIGDKIPLTVQIISLADTMDAMLSNRSYRAALSPLEVYHELQQCGGRQFSPDLIRRLQKSEFWPEGETPLEKITALLNRERWWLNYLGQVFEVLRHPLLLIQSKRLDKLLTAHYKQSRNVI